MRLSEERRPQRARGDSVHEQLTRARGLEDVLAAGGEIVGAVRNIAVDRPRFVGATVTLVVHAPGLEAAGREPVHHRGIGAAGDFQIESRLRGHRGAVHEEHGAAPLRARGREFLPEKQPDLVPALADPVLLPSFRRGNSRVRSPTSRVSFISTLALEASPATWVASSVSPHISSNTRTASCFPLTWIASRSRRPARCAAGKAFAVAPLVRICPALASAARRAAVLTPSPQKSPLSSRTRPK